MKLIDLLYLIAKHYHERNKHGLGRTKLLKLAYLTEVFYKRLTGKRLTDTDWIFWQYGPYVIDYPKILHTNAFVFEPNEGDFQPVLPAENYPQVDVDLEAKIALLRAMDFADENLNQLLDFVYFDTEPMTNAGNRGEKLDFDCVRPEEEYKVKELVLTKDSKQTIRKKIEEWKMHAKK